MNVLRLPFNLIADVLDKGRSLVPYDGEWGDTLDGQTFHVASVAPGPHSRVYGITTAWHDETTLKFADAKPFVAPRIIPDPNPDDHDHTWVGVYTIPDLPRLTAIPSRYTFEPPEAFEGEDQNAAVKWSSTDSIMVVHRGGNRWAITTIMSEVWDDTAKLWQYEPSSSNRGDEFLARTRYDLDTALALAERLANDPWPEKP